LQAASHPNLNFCSRKLLARENYFENTQPLKKHSKERKEDEKNFLKL